jgi:hypothetical protein
MSSMLIFCSTRIAGYRRDGFNQNQQWRVRLVPSQIKDDSGTDDSGNDAANSEDEELDDDDDDDDE